MREGDRAIFVSIAMPGSVHGDTKIVKPLVAGMAVALFGVCYPHDFSFFRSCSKTTFKSFRSTL